MLGNLRQRFKAQSNELLYADLSLLHSIHFEEQTLPSNAIEELQKHTKKFEPDMSAADLKTELDRFKEQWPRLKPVVLNVGGTGGEKLLGGGRGGCVARSRRVISSSEGSVKTMHALHALVFYGCFKVDTYLFCSFYDSIISFFF